MNAAPGARIRAAVLAAFTSAILPHLHAADPAAPVSFSREIAPLLNRRCATCHSEESAKGHYRLDTFARLRKPGESDDPPLVDGRPEESQLYRLLLEPDPEDRMPQKADPLPAVEIDLIKRWISEGAKFDGGVPGRPIVEMARETMLQPAPKHYPRPVPITALAFSPDGRRLAVAGYFEITIWRCSDGCLLRRVGGLPERITALAWHPGRDLIAVAGGSPAQWGMVALIDPNADFHVHILCDLPETTLSVDFSPDGAQLVTGCGDRTMRIFDTHSGSQFRLFRHHADWVQSAAYDSDGTEIVTASRDRTVRIVNGANGELESTYSGHETPLIAADFSRTGDRVISLATRSRELHRWKASSPDDKPEKLRFESEIQRFAIADFGIILTCASDCALHIQRMEDLGELLVLRGHRDMIQSIALAPGANPQEFASGSFDGEVLIWNLACGTWIQRFAAIP